MFDIYAIVIVVYDIWLNGKVMTGSDDPGGKLLDSKTSTWQMYTLRIDTSLYGNLGY